MYAPSSSVPLRHSLVAIVEVRFRKTVTSTPATCNRTGPANLLRLDMGPRAGPRGVPPLTGGNSDIVK